MARSFAFALDFDGTITQEDSTDSLLERFALPEWREVEALWEAGLIGSRECLARQVALLRASPEELDDAIDEAAVDPDFVDFVAEAEARGIALSIVSDGFDRVIRRVLAREGVALPFASNMLTYRGGGRWSAGFPRAREACAAGSGVCKCTARPAAETLVLVGDGRSDFCLAGRSDLVFAKGKLQAHCRAEGFSHVPVRGFSEILGWLENAGADVGHAIAQLNVVGSNVDA